MRLCNNRYLENHHEMLEQVTEYNDNHYLWPSYLSVWKSCLLFIMFLVHHRSLLVDLASQEERDTCHTRLLKS